MHGYPGPDMVPPPPGCRPLPPGPHPPPPDMMYGGPPPDHLLGPHHPDHHPDHLPPPDSEAWSRDGPPGSEIFPPRDGEYSYLDTSDDSGRHTGPDQPSPWAPPTLAAAIKFLLFCKKIFPNVVNWGQPGKFTCYAVYTLYLSQCLAILYTLARGKLVFSGFSSLGEDYVDFRIL